jgi:hypothetical protein
MSEFQSNTVHNNTAHVQAHLRDYSIICHKFQSEEELEDDEGYELISSVVDRSSIELVCGERVDVVIWAQWAIIDAHSDSRPLGETVDGARGQLVWFVRTLDSLDLERRNWLRHSRAFGVALSLDCFACSLDQTRRTGIAAVAQTCIGTISLNLKQFTCELTHRGASFSQCTN